MIKTTYKSDSYAIDFPAKGSRLIYGTSGLGEVTPETTRSTYITKGKLTGWNDVLVLAGALLLLLVLLYSFFS